MNNLSDAHVPDRGRTIDIVKKGLDKRYRKERWFRFCGFASVIIALCFLGLLLISVVSNGYTAFQQTIVRLDVF